MKNQVRYPGTQPFEISQEKIFFGREHQVTEFLQLVKLQRLVVLHGKSGTGKSSLLNAGVLPRIKKGGIFEPVRVRFKTYTGRQEAKSPLQTTKETVRNQLHSVSTFLDRLIADENSLWHDVKEHQIRKNGEQGILLLFDQFEELFSYPDKQIEEFGRQLSEVLLMPVPQRYWDAMDTQIGNGSQLLSPEELTLFQQDVHLKIIIAVRSDHLHLLDQLADFLPGILRHCYKLGPLDRDGAEQAIAMPALLEGDYVTPPFRYEEEALAAVMEFLTQEDSQEMETTQLQILCEALEKKAFSSGSQVVKVEYTQDLDKIVRNFYEEKINALPLGEQPKARKLIEEGLVFEDEDGCRRLSLFEKVIYRDFEIAPATMQQLVNSHLLRVEESRGAFLYELSHDTLLVPVLQARAKRHTREARRAAEQERLELQEQLEKERRRKWRLAAVSFLTILALLSSTLVFFILRKNDQLTAAKAEADVKTKEAVAQTKIAKQEKAKSDSLLLVAEWAKLEAENSRQVAEAARDSLMVEKARTITMQGDDFFRYQEFEYAKNTYREALSMLKKVDQMEITNRVRIELERKIKECDEQRELR